MNFRWLILAVLLASQIHAGVLARFNMKQLGTIDVELYEQDKPVTVSNFVAYVKAGVWNDNIMHRWVQDFVIQGGSYRVQHQPTNPTSSDEEPTTVPTFPAITNEYSVGRAFSNVYGTLAMARVSKQTNSATASWFFNVKDNVELDSVDGGFTVFGRTLAGTNTLNRFKLPAGTTNIFLLRDGTANPSVPIYSLDRTNLFWLNVDITLLTARMARDGGTFTISWDSVEGRDNVVEFATGTPAVWQTLQTVSGTGAAMSVTDTPAMDSARIYRVRIVYPN
jgi:cyclophilin family peptidyl-prolyl cis-trans isomerase